MATKQQQGKGGGSRKYGRHADKCKTWRMKNDHVHAPTHKKFSKSKEHRHCGPIGRKLARSH